MTEQEILNRLEEIRKEKESLNTSTGVNTNQVDQPSTGGTFKENFQQTEPGEIVPHSWGMRKPRPGVGGFIQDVGQRMWENAAPAVGISDTIIDTINLASAGDKYDIPKLPKYESNAVQAIRNISGLVIPSLGLRAKALQWGAKAKAAGVGAPWLQKLGNSKSFEYFAKFGVDVGTGAAVDYVAEQNQQDDNVFGLLKSYWPKTYQWIPDSVATTADDSAGEKRAKNVTEGALFNVLAGIVEGAAYLLKGGRSLKRTSQFLPSKKNGVEKINELAKDEFTDIKFSDKPIEDQVLRGYARKEKELNLLSEYYVSKGEPPIDWDLYDEGETLVRTKDADGIIGAQADAAQIQNNIQSTWGRIGNLVHEAARKEGIELENLTNRTLVSELAGQIKEGGSFSKRLRSGAYITDKMMDEAGKVLAATLLNPRVEPDEIIGLLDEFKRAVDGSAIRIAGKKGINRAVKELTRQLTDLDTHKARAYLATSEAGQVADFSEGARLMEDGDSVLRTVDAMADRLEVLMVEKGLANFEAGSMYANMDAWKKAVDTGDQEIINATADTILNAQTGKLREIIPQVKEWTNTLKTTARENPEFLRPLLLANEFTDGDVDSLFKLHMDASNRLGVFKKAIVDGNPNVPSIINKVWWSNIFNSNLSAMATPAKAAVGNLTGLLGRGLATISGAVLHGDTERATKAMVAHFALDDTLQKAMNHMKLVFKKTSINPKEVSFIMRDDIAIKEEKALTYLRSFADAASENGEDGASMLLSVYDDLDALAQDPVLRFGGNAMTAFDGFAKSVTANTEAKYRVLNKLVQSGEEITDKSFKKAVDEMYTSMQGENGLFNDETVEAINREIALNADSPIVDAFNNFLKLFPAARTFIRYPRTTANVIETFGRWGPAGALASDYRKMWGAGAKSLDSFSFEEIADILQSKGRVVDENAIETFQMLRYETQGKVALGSLAVTFAGFAAINDRCTGNGHYNKAIQRQRVKSGWKAKSCKVPGTDKQVSYDWMGPIGDWLSLTIDTVDNFDSLTTAMQEDLFNKLTFVMGSALFNRGALVMLEPMFDVMQGNGAAATRFLTSFGNDLVPLGGLRNEIGKVLYPQLRQIRAELDTNLRNRNAWLDAFDPERALPSVVDPIDGKEIGQETNWFIRVWNRGPAKVTSKPSKERQFLIDIEFNSSPTMNMSQRGAILEDHEITAINSKMGEMGIYKKKINEIMKDANRLTYKATDGTVYKGFKNIIHAQRRGGIPSDILDSGKYAQIFSRLRSAYADSKRLAEDNLEEPLRSIIRRREYDKQNADYNQKAGKIDQVLQDSGLQKTLNIAK